MADGCFAGHSPQRTLSGEPAQHDIFMGRGAAPGMSNCPELVEGGGVGGEVSALTGKLAGVLTHRAHSCIISHAFGSMCKRARPDGTFQQILWID